MKARPASARPPRHAWLICRGDPRFYTTSIAVQDLEAARQALGYEALNVYGVSYGTRVAQHYARRFPDQVRTLIIDGVAPPTEVPLGPNAALNAERTLSRLFERCRKEPSCSDRFPDLEAKVEALDQRLGRASLLRFPSLILSPGSSLTSR